MGDTDTWLDTVVVDDPGATVGRHSAPATLHSLVEEAGELSLTEELGRGGMGVVRLGHQGRLHREVAVKLSLADRPDLDGPLLREAWLTGLLQHPNIVPVHDLRLDPDGRPQLLMKRISGLSWTWYLQDPDRLPAHAQRDPLQWHLDVLIQICNALELAHAKRILHRDIKPDNVMIGELGEVYLMDWGIAIALDPDPSGRLPDSTLPPRLAGTPLYMAPEMFRPTPEDWGPHTDVYLLGGVLHKVLTLRPPRDPAPIRELFTAACRPPVLTASIPEDLRDLLAATLSPEITARPSLAAFRDALRTHLDTREARRLLTSAERSLDALEAQLQGDQGADRDVYDLFGAARFAFEQAETGLPDPTRAREGRQRLSIRMAEHELERGAPRAAQSLLRQLADPPTSLAQRVSSAVEAAEQRDSKLRSLERDQREGTAYLARVGVLLTLACVWFGMPVLFTGIGWERDYPRLLLQNGIVAGVLVVATAVFWRFIVQSRINRGAMTLLWLSPTLSALFTATLWITGAPMEVLNPVRGLVDGSLLVVAALLIDRRIFPGAVTYCIASVAVAFLPALAGPLLVGATGVLVINAATVWGIGGMLERRRRPR